MTQKFEREAIALVATILVLARALFPRPFIERRTKTPYENQLVVRLCYVAMAVFLFCLDWHPQRVACRTLMVGGLAVSGGGLG